MAIAACILPAKPIHPLDKLTDSKKLSPTMREKLFPIIKDSAESWSVILIPAADIDKYGIQAMNIAGMRRAVGVLDERPHYVLTDAMRVDGLTQPHLPIIGGDSAARCIAAASVLAKVTRDRYMCDLAERYPEYGLEKHKGYGTAQHIDAVRLHGGTPEHRYTYRNVAEAVGAYRAHHSI
ncbi:ribonuclease HII [Corynebacterium kroppenstedtii]|nr:ribonuclease HII [Corynebacterium kroppenstedtii]